MQNICMIALAGLLIGAVATSRQEPGMFKKFLPWIIGTSGLMLLSTITEFFFDPASAEKGIALITITMLLRFRVWLFLPIGIFILFILRLIRKKDPYLVDIILNSLIQPDKLIP